METRSDRINVPIPRRKPRIVGVIASRADWDLVTRGDVSGIDLCELRMDLLAAEGFTEEECQRQLQVSKILTVRDPREGGGTTLTESGRLNLFARFLPHVDYIDVELRNLNRYSGLLSTVRSSAKQLIVSVHDFERTPNAEIMERWVEETAAHQPAAILKIATQMTSWEELVRLGNLLASRRPIRMAAMGMGPFGKISRLLFAQLGSELLYAGCGEAVVPGQWDLRTLCALLPQISEGEFDLSFSR